MKFDELGLGAEVLKAVAETGYTEPTPIQAQAIPFVLKKRDVLGIAQTGTGKTASFTLPMIDLLSRGRAKARMPRSLILEPTRELAAQVAENFETYGKYNKLSMALLIGGVSFGDQEKKLDRGVDVLIATPGRLLDHCGRGKVLLTGVQILVIDEADRMLDMGFIPDIEEICKKIPFTRQTLFFSATMPPEIQRLTDTFLQNPERVEVSRPASASSTITQAVVKTTREGKRDTLLQLIQGEDVKNAIIFCNRKRDIGAVHKSLEKHGLPVGSLHGDLDQSTRTKTLDGFRNGTIRLLVASDVAARGLDIPDVSHVFNFDVPTHAEDYVHRIGRTGRAGRSGAAFTLLTREDGKYLAGIEKLIGNAIPVRGVTASETAPEAETAAPAEDTVSTEETQTQEAPTEGRRPRERRPRGGRGRSKSTEAKSDAVAPEDAPQPVIADPVAELVAEVIEHPAPRHEPRRHEQPRRERNERHDRSRGRGRDDDDGPSVVGLGDHVPAFMLRAVKLPKRSPEAEEDDVEIEEVETEEA
ncbi:MAG: DEAD/DEAH box helicase [Parvibaculum sp.]|uniref:DEAD/DEAH box helicase n=1 Tax=Parvibaculum sp. TaxID=2024848 RepID=UPI0025E5B974|nr:DEAD/DEAH box helicase [Parvibaculum sp.]MCE9648702.1 DEAD/DEAH box helicase [Parvibaculum sp.]